MNFVYDVNFVLADGGRKTDFVGKLSYLVDRVVGSGVDFKNIEVRIGRKLHAVFALSARRTVRKRRKAVDRPCKNLRNGSFARASRAGENVRMPDVAVSNLIFERAHDMILPDDFVESVGTIFAI